MELLPVWPLVAGIILYAVCLAALAWTARR